MLEQLSNPLHYLSTSDDRTKLHLDRVKEWSDEWLVQQQITDKIANWVVNLEPKAGDTTHLINEIDKLNKKGPSPPDTLLVSWDVVAMFPNIDNNLGLTAVKKALDSRENKFPSTKCIVEAVEICLACNNCQFGEMNFLQKHGTAMGPKNACSYADIAMGGNR
ncbi:Hypothetical predicted protein [Paramuricea clavata]|uniref:Uncharacterized protein n=1 Tax=Paramuricea clavata TaxID=317549 RepID=A0A6S7GFK5_PARCT|nr:Hypothetical predicted protein [Paramuricea clavata]